MTEQIDNIVEMHEKRLTCLIRQGDSKAMEYTETCLTPAGVS